MVSLPPAALSLPWEGTHDWPHNLKAVCAHTNAHTHTHRVPSAQHTHLMCVCCWRCFLLCFLAVLAHIFVFVHFLFSYFNSAEQWKKRKIEGGLVSDNTDLQLFYCQFEVSFCMPSSCSELSTFSSVCQ